MLSDAVPSRNRFFSMETPMPVAPLEPNFYSTEYQEDPTPILTRLRAEDPVHKSQHGYWFLTRYADVKAVLRDARFSSDWSRRPGGGLLRTSAPETDRDQSNRALILSSFNMKDGAEHQRIRTLVNHAFSKASLESKRGRIEEIAQSLLPAAGTEFDLVTEYAFPLPIQISCEMIGIPPESRERFRRSFEEAEGLSRPGRSEEKHRRGLEALDWQITYMRELLDERRASPTNDLLSALVEAEEDGLQLSADEAIAAVVTIFTAAGTTTERFISSGLLLLLQHPEERIRLQEERDLMPTALEEILRYHHPDQSTSTPRWVTEDLELRGKLLSRGDTVRLGLGAANRDPDQFPDPERFDVSRTPNRHLSFGRGGHFCVGASLARMIGDVAISSVLDRYRDLRLVTEQPRRDPRRMDRYERIIVRG
jgi:cytochrome P450